MRHPPQYGSIYNSSRSPSPDPAQDPALCFQFVKKRKTSRKREPIVIVPPRSVLEKVAGHRAAELGSGREEPAGLAPPSSPGVVRDRASLSRSPSDQSSSPAYPTSPDSSGNSARSSGVAEEGREDAVRQLVQSADLRALVPGGRGEAQYLELPSRNCRVSPAELGVAPRPTTFQEVSPRPRSFRAPTPPPPPQGQGFPRTSAPPRSPVPRREVVRDNSPLVPPSHRSSLVIPPPAHSPSPRSPSPRPSPTRQMQSPGRSPRPRQFSPLCRQEGVGWGLPVSPPPLSPARSPARGELNSPPASPSLPHSLLATLARARRVVGRGSLSPSPAPSPQVAEWRRKVDRVRRQSQVSPLASPLASPMVGRSMGEHSSTQGAERLQLASPREGRRDGEEGRDGGGRRDNGREGGGRRDSGREGGGRREESRGGGRREEGRDGGGRREEGREGSEKREKTRRGRREGGRRGSRSSYVFIGSDGVVLARSENNF